MNADPKKLAEAVELLGNKTLYMIGQILKKHHEGVLSGSIEAIIEAVNAEREACAKLCDALEDEAWARYKTGPVKYRGDSRDEARSDAACSLAEQIRARGKL